MYVFIDVVSLCIVYFTTPASPSGIYLSRMYVFIYLFCVCLMQKCCVILCCGVCDACCVLCGVCCAVCGACVYMVCVRVCMSVTCGSSDLFSFDLLKRIHTQFVPVCSLVEYL